MHYPLDDLHPVFQLLFTEARQGIEPSQGATHNPYVALWSERAKLRSYVKYLAYEFGNVGGYALGNYLRAESVLLHDEYFLSEQDRHATECLRNEPGLQRFLQAREQGKIVQLNFSEDVYESPYSGYEVEMIPTPAQGLDTPNLPFGLILEFGLGLRSTTPQPEFRRATQWISETTARLGREEESRGNPELSNCDWDRFTESTAADTQSRCIHTLCVCGHTLQTILGNEGMFYLPDFPIYEQRLTTLMHDETLSVSDLLF